MENFIFYLLKSGIWITVFYSIYWLFLRKEIFFQFNRFFLLAGLPASFALALCQYHYPVNLNIQLLTALAAVASQPAPTGWVVDWPLVIAAIYVSGMLILLLHYLFGLNKIGRLIRNQKSKTNTKPPVIEIPQIQSSFSFFGYVFMDQTTPFSEVEKRLILAHETAHVEQHHWVDLFLSQMVCALQWFNPFAWLYRNAIKQNHEFLADRSVIQKGNSQAVYHAALINYTFKAPIFALTNAFTYHKFKRITMMKKNVSNPAKKFATLLLIPALAVFLWAFAKPEYKYSMTIQSEVEMTAVKDTVIITTDKEPNGIKVITTGKVKTVKTIGTKKTEEQVFNSDSVVVIGYGSMNKRISGNSVNNFPITGVYTTCDTAPINLTQNTNRLKLFLKPNSKDPLIIVDGKESSSLSQLSPDEIHSISILKDATAISVYGDAANNGIILVTTKKHAEETGETDNFDTNKIKHVLENIQAGSASKDPLVIIDGKSQDYSKLKKLNPKNIENITVLKDQSAADIYGDKGKNGVILVTTK
jgi:TonB-dependent SusC/RagA subfamily outer membrane receptor